MLSEEQLSEETLVLQVPATRHPAEHSRHHEPPVPGQLAPMLYTLLLACLILRLQDNLTMVNFPRINYPIIRHAQ